MLLVHPGGPFWAKKDDGAWSIPKGEFSDAEEPLAAARREFEEEMGRPIDGEFLPLEPIRQAGGKRVLAWAVRADFDPSHVSEATRSPWNGRHNPAGSSSFPKSTRPPGSIWRSRKQKILKGQAPLLDELSAKSQDVQGSRAALRF